MVLKSIEKVFKRTLNYGNISGHRKFLALVNQRQISRQAVQDAKVSAENMAFFKLSSSFWHEDRGRYAYLLIKSFAVAGYQISLARQFSFLSQLTKYKKLLHSLNFTIFDPKDIADDLTTDDMVVVCSKDRCKRVHLIIDTTKHLHLHDGQAMPMPYLMHPMIYEEGLHVTVEDLRKNDAYRKIFFAGNVDPKNYSKKVIAKQFGKMHRFQTISSIERALTSEEITIITEKDELYEPANYQNKLIIVKSSDYKIPFHQWLSTLSRSDFFLSCAGAHMPMCHNAIEAMAVGSIPLLEYPEYFHPALEHQKNCIVFRGEKDLMVQIKQIFSMPADDIAAMKKNVTDYYDTYLRSEVWVHRLTQHHTSEDTKLIVNAYAIPE